jgi:hypothetical protein
MTVCLFIQMITTTHADFDTFKVGIRSTLDLGSPYASVPPHRLDCFCSMLIMTTVCQYLEAVTASSTCSRSLLLRCIAQCCQRFTSCIRVVIKALLTWQQHAC